MTTTRAERLANNAAKTIPYALHALGLHLIDHTVPSPRSIDITDVTEGNTTTITITVAPCDADPWCDSIAVTHTDQYDSAYPGRVIRRTHGLLPDTGVRVTIVASHPATLVSA